ncbi:MAG: hypothetical protein WEB58_18760 [Planctomycetaceae bacterium]
MTFFLSALAIATAGGDWHFSPLAKDHVRPIDVRADGDPSWPVPGRIDVYDSPATFNALSSTGRIELSRPVDFSQEKLLHVGWRAVGCYSEEMKASGTPVTPLFGALGYYTRHGGQDVVFYVESPVPGSLFGTVVHQVFEQRIGSEWFTVPQNVRMAYDEYGSPTGSDVVMALLLFLTVVLVIVAALTARPWSESAAALEAD